MYLKLSLNGAGEIQIPPLVNFEIEYNNENGYKYFKYKTHNTDFNNFGAKENTIRKINDLAYSISIPKPIIDTTEHISDMGFLHLKILDSNMDINLHSYGKWPLNWIKVIILHDALVDECNLTHKYGHKLLAS